MYARWLVGPGALETWLTVLVLALLLPQFSKLGTHPYGRDGRFDPMRLPSLQMPSPVLPRLCSGFSGHLPEADRRTVCNASEQEGQGSLVAASSDIERQLASIRSAFKRPVAVEAGKIDTLLLRRHEGVGDPEQIGEEIAELEAQVRPYLTRFSLASIADPFPRGLACLDRQVHSFLSSSQDEIASFRALFWYASVLDGAPASRSLAIDGLGDDIQCAKGPGGVIAADSTREVLRLAFNAQSESTKAAAMRNLMNWAGWQFALWAAAGLLFVKWARFPGAVLPRLGLGLIMWSGLFWFSRVYLKSAEEAGVGWSGVTADAATRPPGIVLALLGAGVALLIAGRLKALRISAPKQNLSSRIGYAGLVAFIGIGWLLLLDLSAGGHPRNRYLGLYQQGIVWGGFAIVSLVALSRPLLGIAFARVAAWLSLTFGRLRERFRWTPFATGVLAIVVTAIFFGIVLRNLRQFTSELGRLLLILGAAGFFYLRGEYAGDWRSRTDWLRFLRYLSPLLLILLLLATSMLASDDLGPLLVTLYAGGVFFAAALSTRQQRTHGNLIPLVGGAGLLVVWVIGVTTLVYGIGPQSRTVASRIESTASPFSSINDQLAIITWFREATPAFGHGIGNTPWCGRVTGSGCTGVPLQIQSDYTFTALSGVFGVTAATIICFLMFFWLCRLVWNHSRFTSGLPQIVGGTRLDTQGLLSWISVGWVALVLCQLSVTVAGNVGLLPLTGITFPFVSYGMMSLWFNAAYFALCVNIDHPQETI